MCFDKEERESSLKRTKGGGTLQELIKIDKDVVMIMTMLKSATRMVIYASTNLMMRNMFLLRHTVQYL